LYARRSASCDRRNGRVHGRRSDESGRSDAQPQGSRKDEPIDDRDNRNAKSRDELKERSVHGARPGKGLRLGSLDRQ